MSSLLLPFCRFPLKYLTWVRMYNRCPLLTLPFICMHVGVIMHLGWAAWWVTVQWWSFKWGGREAWQGRLLLPSALPASLVAAHSLTDLLCLSSVPMDTSAWTWRHYGITHKGQGMLGFYSLPQRVLETHRLSDRAQGTRLDMRQHTRG